MKAEETIVQIQEEVQAKILKLSEKEEKNFEKISSERSIEEIKKEQYKFNSQKRQNEM